MGEPVKLIPVSQWVYDLYEVIYWTSDPDLPGSRRIRSSHVAASSENHLHSSAWDLEYAPRDAEFMTSVRVRENVGHPRVIGQMYGQNIHESGNAHGRRLAEQM